MFNVKKGQKITEEVRRAMLAEPITDDPNAKRLGKHNADKILRRARARDRVDAWERGDISDKPDGPKTSRDTTKAVAAQTHVRDRARKYTDVAIRTLVEVMQYAKKAKDRTTAAEVLLDRGWGKPVQGIEHSGPDGSSIPIQHLIDRPPQETYQQWQARVTGNIQSLNAPTAQDNIIDVTPIEESKIPLGLEDNQENKPLELKSDDPPSPNEVLTPTATEISLPDKEST